MRLIAVWVQTQDVYENENMQEIFGWYERFDSNRPSMDLDPEAPAKCQLKNGCQNEVSNLVQKI